MREWAGRRYWLVGASEGLGRALAHRMAASGVDLVLSARSADRLQALAAELPRRAEIVPCDVTDEASVADAAGRAGALDGVVYLAGLYWPMPARCWDPVRAAAMCDANLTGAVRVLGHLVPGMIERDRGHVVITGSLAGFRGLPGSIGYAASKAGVMGLAESLYADLRGTGVEVQLVNPGFIRTRLTEKNDFNMPFIMSPDEAARRMFEHMGTNRFKTSFPTAFSLFFRLGQLLPDWAWYPLLPRR
ncbi:MAG: SDR family NAD(P)-dependent oxidoreductase [Gemmobacter sp.]